MKLFKNFRKDEDGAVTVDWVVLTAAVLALGYVVLNTVSSGASGLAQNIETELKAVKPEVSGAKK